MKQEVTEQARVEANHSIPKRTKRVVAWILLCISFAVIAVTGWQMYQAQKVYREADQSYDALAQRVRSYGSEESSSTLEFACNRNLSVDFKQLGTVNPDTVGWLYSPDTPIDYPIMEAEDYDWYLRHLPDGTANANGSLFLDYNGEPDFSGKLSVIYGHHMRSGKMFASLMGYKKQGYFEDHPDMHLHTKEGNYRIELIYGCIIESGQWRNRAFMFEKNLTSLLDYAATNTTFKSDVTYTEKDRFVALSTCSYEFDDARYVVIGVLSPE